MQRSNEAALQLAIGFAKKNPRVQYVGYSGSLTNPQAKHDEFSDLDLVLGVAEFSSWRQDESWLAVFGPRLIMEKPEAMALFPPDPVMVGKFTYLMQFKDGSRIDLTLDLQSQDQFLAADSLNQLVWSRTQLPSQSRSTSDRDYWVERPNQQLFDDCCTEFYWLAFYVAKGIVRQDPLYAQQHLQLQRNMLLQMLAWQAGRQFDFQRGFGKNNQQLAQILPPETWQQVLDTFGNCETQSLLKCFAIMRQAFRQASLTVSQQQHFIRPIADSEIEKAIKTRLEKIQ